MSEELSETRTKIPLVDYHQERLKISHYVTKETGTSRWTGYN